MGGKAAKAIGEKLERAMRDQGMTPADLATRAGKRVDHVEAVLAGFPNTTQRPTELDTVDEFAAELAPKLDLSPE